MDEMVQQLISHQLLRHKIRIHEQKCFLPLIFENKLIVANALRLRAANPAPFEYFEAGSNRRYIAALDGAFALISGSNPARRGQVAQLYVNGLGPVDRSPGSGQISPSNPLARTTTNPLVTIGGRPAQLLFSGLAPGIVGLYQVNVVIPTDAPTGQEVELTIQKDGVISRSSRIAVQ